MCIINNVARRISLLIDPRAQTAIHSCLQQGSSDLSLAYRYMTFTILMHHQYFVHLIKTAEIRLSWRLG